MIPSQMLKGILENCILQIISCKETYGYEISLQLQDYGFGEISEGTIYPILLRLEKTGSIEAIYKKSSLGPKRKYFTLTKQGKEELNDFIKHWQSLSHAVNTLLITKLN